MMEGRKEIEKSRTSLSQIKLHDACFLPLISKKERETTRNWSSRKEFLGRREEERTRLESRTTASSKKKKKKIRANLHLVFFHDRQFLIL